ncbi:MAG: fumarylacetoacetate hydrolase family protein [Desulfobacterales bacterium]|nr:fumarylacetoacetate hydrolase family protein [Desulfobacterales bacterium]
MRLIRFFNNNGEIRPGILQGNLIIDLKKVFPDIPDISETFFKEGWIETIASATLPKASKLDVHISYPVCCPSKIICLGKNYIEHAKEGGFDLPKKPLIFSKSANTLTGPFDPVIMPKTSSQVDWEVELAVIIGKQGKGISKQDAHSYVAGFTVMNDVSARDVQFSESQWFRGKSFDTFAPLGPSIVTPDEIGGLDKAQNLRLTAKVNGKIMQDGNTKDMIFDIPSIIEDISQDMTLMPGDIISTGTPAGVGIFRNPPILLKSGDIVECEVEKIGIIRNVFK